MFNAQLLKFGYWQYNLLLVLASPVIWAYFIWRAIKAKDYREGFLQRFGLVKCYNNQDKLLVHCASIGEAKAAIPLIKQLIEKYTNHQIVVTSTTPTGKQALIEAFGNSVTHYYLPIDWVGACARFIRSVNPKLVIIMETELWPNLLKQLDKKAIPVLLANARLSQKSVNKYLKHRQFSKQIFSYVSLIAAQYQSDAKRFAQLNEKNAVVITGNIKFDLSLPKQVITAQKEFKTNILKNRKVWLAASIHPKEFEAIVLIHKKLCAKYPDLLLIGIPRHPEKFTQFEDCVKQAQLNYVTRSSYEVINAETQVLVGDTMGEVTLFCGVADVAFIGGSLIPRGGHNPLEATVSGTPVIMGSSIYNFADISDLLIKEGCLVKVNNKTDLFQGLNDLLENRVQQEVMSKSALALMQNNRGCVDKLVNLAEQLLVK